MRLSWRSDSVLFLLLGILFCLLGFTIAHSERRNPVTYITRVENPTIKTPSHKAHAHSSFDIVFTLHDGTQDVKFTLEPNHDIIPEGASIQYLDDNGYVEREVPMIRHEYKVYKGNSWLRDGKGWTYAGWARIVISRDGENPMFEGAFTLNHDAHHIHSRTNYLKMRQKGDPLVQKGGDEFMLVWRDSDVMGNSFRSVELKGRSLGNGTRDDIMCPSDGLDFNAQPGNPVNKMILERERGIFGSLGLDALLGGGRVGVQKRQTVDDTTGGNSAVANLRNNIGSTSGCPKTRMVALMGVATDCTYTSDFDSEQTARTNIIRQINTASDLYEKTFNITLGLSQLVISKASCPGTAPEGSKWNVPCDPISGATVTTIENRLNLFSQWRGQSPRSNDSLAFWTLLTTCETGSSVGLAWLGQLCKREANTNSQDGSFVSGANVVARTDTEWKVIAHEIGHTLGAVHDCTETTCVGNAASASMCCPLSATGCDAGGNYIMNPSTNGRIQDFSPCSVGNICTAFRLRSVDSTCLSSNRGVTIITERECGNGIVEEGEDCDCGGTAGCGANNCCDAATCKFKNNAVCDDANEECCTRCQFSPANTVCRQSNGECDPEEKCTGSNPICPNDVVSPDGTSCSGGLKCASGQCTSRDRQCQSVMGRISTNNDTHSCDDSNCVLTCQSPELGADTCLRMQQNFLDGTPCRGDGTCKNGFCSGASALGEVKSWIDRHRNLVIGVGSGLGAIFLFLILSCCWSRFRRGRRRPKIIQPAMYGGVPPSERNNPPTRWQSLRANDYPRPPPMAQRGFNPNIQGHGRRGGSDATSPTNTYSSPVRYA